MASVVITNLDSSPLYMADMYVTIPVSGSITVVRSASDLARMADLQNKLANGKVSVGYTRTADEVASGLDLPQVIEGRDVAPVAAAAPISGASLIRSAFVAAAAGTADDVTVYAVNTFPFKARVVNIWGFVTTNIGGSTLAVRTAAAGAGTLLGTLDSATTGFKALTATTASTVVTPGGSVGLFIRRSDRGVAGEVYVEVRAET